MASDQLDKRLLIVTGKGGSGKSTLALALALAASASGRRTALCEVASQRRVARMFGVPPADSGETRVAERLWSVPIDPEQAMREYVLMALKVRPMRDLLFRLRIFNYLAAATPGLRELVTVGKLWELSQRRRRAPGGEPYDLVVVDAPASGHGLALLETPRTFAALAAGGPLRSQAEALDAMLTDPQRCGIALVAAPEEIAVNETIELERRLIELGMPVERILCNRVRPRRFSAGERDALLRLAHGPGGGPAAIASRAALSASLRAEAEQRQVERLERSVTLSVERLPFLFEPSLDPEAVRELAELVG